MFSWNLFSKFYLSAGRSSHLLCDLPQVDPSGQVHPPRVDLQDLQPGLLTGSRKLNLTIDAAGTEQSRVEDVDAVGGHDDLDVLRRLEAVQLIEEFEHRPLNFRIAAAGLDSRRSDGVDLVHEDDGGRVLASHGEQLSDHPGSFSDVLLDQLGSGHPDEGAVGVMGDGASEEGLSGAWRSVEKNSLGLSDAESFEDFRMFDRQLDDLLDFLDLLLEAADHVERRIRNLLDQHEGDLKKLNAFTEMSFLLNMRKLPMMTLNLCSRKQFNFKFNLWSWTSWFIPNSPQCASTNP